MGLKLKHYLSNYVLIFYFLVFFINNTCCASNIYDNNNDNIYSKYLDAQIKGPTFHNKVLLKKTYIGYFIFRDKIKVDEFNCIKEHIREIKHSVEFTQMWDKYNKTGVFLASEIYHRPDYCSNYYNDKYNQYNEYIVRKDDYREERDIISGDIRLYTYDYHFSRIVFDIMASKLLNIATFYSESDRTNTLLYYILKNNSGKWKKVLAHGDVEDASDKEIQDTIFLLNKFKINGNGIPLSDPSLIDPKEKEVKIKRLKIFNMLSDSIKKAQANKTSLYVGDPHIYAGHYIYIYTSKKEMDWTTRHLKQYREIVKKGVITKEGEKLFDEINRHKKFGKYVGELWD